MHRVRPIAPVRSRSFRPPRGALPAYPRAEARPMKLSSQLALIGFIVLAVLGWTAVYHPGAFATLETDLRGAAGELADGVSERSAAVLPAERDEAAVARSAYREAQAPPGAIGLRGIVRPARPVAAPAARAADLQYF